MQQSMLWQDQVSRTVSRLQMKSLSKPHKMSNKGIQMKSEMKLNVFCRNMVILLKKGLNLHFGPNWSLIS